MSARYTLDDLLRISEEIIGTTDPEKLYRRVVATVHDFLELDFSSLMLFTEGRDRLVMMECLGFPESMKGSFVLMEGHGLATHVAKNAVPDTVLDFSAEERFVVPPIVAEKGIRSAVCVPMMLEGEVFGVLIGHTLRRHQFTSEEISLYCSIGNQAAVAIKNAQHIQALRLSKLELKESRERIGKILHSLPVAIVVADETSGTITDANDRAAAMLGETRESLLGSDYRRLLCPEGAEGCPTPPPGGMLDNVEGRIITSGGKGVPVLRSVVEIPLDGRGHRLESFIDITERKEAEEERLRLMDEINQKNAELQGIIYIASHDLRSPLVNIQGFSHKLKKDYARLSQLLEGVEMPPEVRDDVFRVLNGPIPRALSFIAKSVEKMDSLLAGLLRLARLGSEAITITPIDMKRLVESVVADHAWRIQKGTVVVEVGELPYCMGDQVQINQVFSNLLDNALKYRNPGRTPRIRVSGERKGRCIIYCVEDNGIGIPPEQQKRIWEIFHRLDPQGEVAGEGLGLTVVQRILGRNHGTIRVESEPDRWSRFYVTLPAVG